MVKTIICKNELGEWVSTIATAVGLPDPNSHTHGHSSDDTPVVVDDDD